MRKWLYPLCLWAVALTACEDLLEDEKPQEAEKYPLQVTTVLPGNNGWVPIQEDDSLRPVPNTQLYFYGSEIDYQLDQHVLFEGVTDEQGVFKAELDKPDTLWVRAVNGKLTDTRFSRYHVDKRSCERKVTNELYCNSIYLYKPLAHLGNSVMTVLTPPASKLQLTVYHNGEVVPNAEVTLYFSEEAYQTGMSAAYDIDELKDTYGIFTMEGSYGLSNYTHRCLTESLIMTTDEEGIAYFDNLEPRQYWFTVEKDELSNATATITTGKALSESSDVTTSLTVGIE